MTPEDTTTYYKYKGREVYIESEILEQDEDVTKLWHSLKDAKTKEVICHVDWSPYSEMSEEDIKLYLELDCPRRNSLGPLDNQDLLDLKKKKILKEKLISGTKEISEDIII